MADAPAPDASNKLSPEKRAELQAKFNSSLVKFREQVKAPFKNGHVDFSTKNSGRKKYDYVLLDDLIKSIDEGCKGTGLAWYQEAEVSATSAGVRTVITHENGFLYRSPWMRFSTNGDPQSTGSVITYAKRYSLGTSFGVSSEADDDDGNAAKGNESRNNNQSQRGNNNGQQRRNNSQQHRQNSGSTDTSSGPFNQAKHQIELISSFSGRPTTEIYQELLGITGYAESELENTGNAVKFFNAAKQMRHDLGDEN